MKFPKQWRARFWIFFLLSTFAVAQSTSNVSSSQTVPHLVKYSSNLKDESGHAKSGVLGVTFALYKEQEGGAPLWLEIQNVTADSKGNYTALLGSTKPDGLPAELFTSNEAHWLGVQPEGQAEQPRVLFVSVPYALKAADAETVGGLPPSAFMRVNPANDTANSDVSPTGVSASSTPLNTPLPASSLTVNTPSPGDTPGFVPVWTGTTATTHTLGSSQFFQTSTKLIGLNTKTPGASLEIDSPTQEGLFVNAPFTGVGAGIDLHTTGTGGKGWEILATGSTAAQGPSKLNIRDLSTAADIFTVAPGGLVGINNTNPATVLQVTDNNVPCCAVGTVIAADAFKVGTAVFGDVTGTSGLSEAVFGQIFSPVTSSAAVLGEANGTSGQTSGVSGFNRSSSTFAAGVVAAEEASSGFTLGVSAVSDSPNGAGVLGLGQGMSNTGNNLVGCCAFGVWGDTRSNVFGDAALIGTADEARAIYLQNNSTVVPTAFMFQGAANQLALQAGGNGGFCTIDSNGHENCPGGFSMNAATPGGRQVELYAMGAAQNWFEDFGSGRLASGVATVALEPTFAQTVNSSSDYHVFLTPEGDCRGLYVSSKSASGFEVRELGGGQSNVAFDFRIVALRRGYENVRLEDKTEMMTKLKASIPKPSATPGPRFMMPPAPPAPRKGNPVALNAQR